MSQSQQTRWTIVLLAVLAGMAAGMQVGKVPPAIPNLEVDLGITRLTAGWIASIFNAMGALAGVAAGMVADRLGHRRVLLIGLACLGAGSALGAAAPDGAVLLASRFLEGVGFVTIVVAAPALIVAAATVRDQRLVLGIWSLYMPAGMTVMMLATPTLIQALGWRGLWAVNAGLVIAIAVVLGATTRGLGAPPAVTRHWAEVARALAAPGPWLLGLMFTTYTIQWFGVLSWLPTYLIETGGVAAASAALITAGAVACNMAGNLTGTWLAHRGVDRSRTLMVVCLCLAVLSLGVYIDGPPPALKPIFAAAFSLIGGVLPAAVFSGVGRHSGSAGDIGTVSGVVVQFSNLGAVAGPPLIAAAVGWFGGWSDAGWVLFAAGMAGVAVAFALGRVERRLDRASPARSRP